MAITVTAQINGQIATSTSTYCYLYEPLRVFVEESTLTAEKLYIDVQPYNTGDGVPISTLVKYAEFDINPGVGLTIDLMKIAQQINDAGIWKYSSVDDLVGSEGWRAIIAQYRYKFHIYSDENPTPVVVYKLPINGGRQMSQFVPTVLQTQYLNEFEYYGLDTAELESRWDGIQFPTASLNDPAAGGSVRPTLTKITNVGVPPCGGFLIWKSRFGGWMWWGFDFQTKSFSKNYEGNLQVGMFESTLDKVGDTYIPVNYTGINTSYNITMKSLGLSSDELLAVSGIHASPAVYYQYPGTGTVELMRLTSFSAPVSTLAQGGDFSVTLKNISRTSQLAI